MTKPSSLAEGVLLGTILLVPIAPNLTPPLFAVSMFLILPGIEWQDRWSCQRSRWLLVAALLGVGWILARSFWSGSGSATGYPVTATSLVLYPLAGLAIAWARPSPAALGRLLVALVSTVPLYALMVLAQVVFEVSGPVRWGGDDLPRLWFYLPSPVEGRVSGSFGNWNGFGTHLLLTLLATAGLLALATHRRAAVALRAAVIVALLTCLVLLAWTGSIAAFLSLSTVCILSTLTGRVVSRRLIGALLGTWLVLGLAVFSGSFGGDLSRSALPRGLWARLVPPESELSRADGRNLELPSEQTFTNNSAYRLRIFDCGLGLVREKPWVGWGPNRTGPMCEERMETRPHEVNHAHNLYLQLAADLGFPFALLALLGTVCVVVCAGREVTRITDPSEAIVRETFLLMFVGVFIGLQFQLAVFHESRLKMIVAIIGGVVLGQVANGSAAREED